MVIFTASYVRKHDIAYITAVTEAKYDPEFEPTKYIPHHTSP